MSSKYDRNELASTRRYLGITQKYMAKKLGLSATLYSRIEQGTRIVTIGEALVMADILKKPVDVLFFADKQHVMTKASQNEYS